ncbi:MAG: diguanylate cyclase [Syntrophales bacterium LBB04]|nr:diguanylate cyclase [Syntrophales bacterium LBB04]
MKDILLISRDAAFIGIINNMIKDGYNKVLLSNMQSALDYIFNSIPDLLIIDIQPKDSETVLLLNGLKEDPLFKQIPVLACLPDLMPIPDWKHLFVEDFIMKSKLEQEILERVSLSIYRSERLVEINPLTRLPGNISINYQIQERLDRGEHFALAYTDIDNFKPFNDKYGFSRGDEVLRITGRLITNIVKNSQPHESFAGHIGGDDFVFIMEPALIEDAAKEIIKAFDSIAPSLYDADDRQKGSIESLNRRGETCTFPFLTISIGISDTGGKKFLHYGALTEAASEMKHYAKQFTGSCYRWNMRGE